MVQFPSAPHEGIFGNGAKSPLILSHSNLSLDGDEWSASRSSRLTPLNLLLLPTGCGLRSHRAGLERKKNKQFFASNGNLITIAWLPSANASHQNIQRNELNRVKLYQIGCIPLEYTCGHWYLPYWDKVLIIMMSDKQIIKRNGWISMLNKLSGIVKIIQI
jgi:hypothetical protein